MTILGSIVVAVWARGYRKIVGLSLASVIFLVGACTEKRYQVDAYSIQYPNDAFKITSDFRDRYNSIGQKRRKPHSGIDIPTPIGSPVLAVADGYVYRSRYHSSNGNEIKIKHAFGTMDEIRAQYIHLDRRLVEVGDKVKRGQVIGTVGQTGSRKSLTSGVSHLHLALWTTSRRGAGGRCCRNENPHEYWYDGVGEIALFRPNVD